MSGEQESAAVEPREQDVERLTAQVQEQSARLEEQRGVIAGLERRQRIDGRLTEARVIDLEAARLLAEATLETGEASDVEGAVTALRAARPYLFATARRSGAAMSPAVAEVSGPERAAAAAEAAATTGRRADLLRYLRLRRRGK